MYSKQFIFILQVRNCPSQPQSTVIGTGGHRGAVGIGQQQRFGLVVKRRRLLQQFALQLRIGQKRRTAESGETFFLTFARGMAATS